MKEESKKEIISSDDDSEDEIDYNNSEYVKCRFYRKKMPSIGDLVSVVTERIVDNGAYVQLVEYDNILGMISLSHVTQKRVKSVHKFLKIGKQEMMEVFRVDEDKMCIDLTKKSLKTDAINDAHKKLKKSKQVHTIMRQTAIKLKTPVE